jgi:hypothetical protein
LRVPPTGGILADAMTPQTELSTAILRSVPAALNAEMYAGRISEHELAAIETFFSNLSLTAEQAAKEMTWLTAQPQKWLQNVLSVWARPVLGHLRLEASFARRFKPIRPIAPIATIFPLAPSGKSDALSRPVPPR